MVIVYSNQRIGFAQHNLYAIDVDWRNMNCYNCRRFGHLARNHKNRGMGNRIGEGKRLEYGQNNGGSNRQNNLNREGDLIVFN